jgi:uroporphyrinogen-III synthase
MQNNRVFLLTREINKALETKKTIVNLGGKAVIHPLCEVKKNSINLPDFNFAYAFIFTSSNGFDLNLLDYWRQANKQIRFFIIGASFAKLLEKHQIYNYQYFNSAQELISYLQEGYHENIKFITQKLPILYYFKGNYTKYNLKLLLTKYKVQERICYDVIYHDNNDILTKIIDYKITDILFFSLYNAQYFFSLIKNNNVINKNIKIYGLSKEIADLFTKEGYKNAYYPAIPNMKSLIKIL